MATLSIYRGERDVKKMRIMKPTKNEDFSPIIPSMFYYGGPLCVPNWVPAEIGLAWRI